MAKFLINRLGGPAMIPMDESHSPDALRSVRKALFECFPRGDNIDEVIAYQERLAREIFLAEKKQADNPTPHRKEHLRALRLYGDALAFSHLSEHAIRQLSRNPGSRAHLFSQGEAFAFTLNSAREVATTGHLVLIADLTNVLRIGDLVVCDDPDAPSVLECKSGGPRPIAHEPQGRTRRQLARMESIAAFLRDGRGVIFGETAERRTITVAGALDHNFAIVNELVLTALANHPSTRLLPPWELVSAAAAGQTAPEIQNLISEWGAPPRTPVLIGNTSDPITRPPSDIPPPILWPIAAEAQWALMEVDVTVTHAFRLDAFIGLSRGLTRVLSLLETKGDIPWAYEVQLGDERITLNAVAARDVVYRYQTVQSAGERLVDTTITAFQELGDQDWPSSES